MVFLSAHFAVLACLCAALPLAFPPPVEAAHLYGSHSMQKHASSTYSQQRTRTHDGSFFGWPTATHIHDGKNHGHQAPDHRASQLPPLLQRYRAHDHNKVHNQHEQGPHDDGHHKVPRSAFARSRFRRAPAYLSRRSSVYVPGEHGNTYLVSRTPVRNWGNGHTGMDKQPSHAYNPRQVDESNVVLGRVDIMGAAQSPGSTQRLASLTVDSVAIDWTSGQSSAKAFPMNASTANQTQFIMMPVDGISKVAGSSNKQVTLATEVFDASNAEMVMYCATYDSDPGATSALLMTPCTSTGTTQSGAPVDDAADSCADDGNDASSTSHESQIFSYDPSSGQIEPISATDSSSGTGNSSDDPISCAGARVRRDNGNYTTSSPVRPSSTSTSTAPTPSASQLARNVTLVFVAGALELAAPSPSSSRPTNTTTTSIGQASVLTKTITTTVVAGVTASGPSAGAGTVTPAQAAVSISTSSIPSPSTTISAPSGFITVTTTATRSSSSLSSSVSATATSRTPANADESFEVEIVGIAPTTTASSSPASTATITTTSSSSSGSVSTGLDALAVASSIANAMASPQAAVFASASISPVL